MTDSSDERERPQRVRFTKLQEAQLQPLVELEGATTAMYHELGFDAAEVPPRSQLELAQLPRTHSVVVAEADHVVAGYAAWRQEEPGVAFVEEVGVHPAYQRFGIGRQLIDKIREEARECDIAFIVLRTWDRAPWAAAFYQELGFRSVARGPEGVADGSLPEGVRLWFERKNDGRPFLRRGESALFALVGEAHPAANDGEDEPPDDTENPDAEPPDDVA